MLLNKLRLSGARIARFLFTPADLSERRFSIISFFLPFALLLCAYFASGLYPFGNNSPLSFDLYAQYVQFFAGLKNMLASGEGIVYTWCRTLGGEYLGIIAYYLLSPLNIIIFILPLSMIETAVLLTILGKTGAIGATAYAYFHRAIRVDRQGALIFSTAYAMCAYCVVYGSNLMWLDALFILPLLIWGIEKLVRGEGFGLYVFSLAYAMITNYYMGFMLCIVTMIYFFAYRFGRYADNANGSNAGNTFIRSLVRIGIFTAIALAISAIVILPAYHSLSFGKTEFTIQDFTPRQTADFLAIFKKLLIGSHDTVTNNGLPFIYCSMLTLIFAPAYFVSQRIGKREKLASALIVGFLLASFSLSTLDIVWHGFQFPNGLNHRYSFILSFFLCFFAARAYRERDGISKKSVLAIFAALCLMIAFTQAQHYSFGNEFICIWMSMIVLAIYTAVICFLGDTGLSKHLSMILVVLLSIEAFAASAVNLVSYDNDIAYAKHGNMESNVEKYAPIVDAIYLENPDFYRVERVGNRLHNDPLSLNMRGICSSTSTLNASVIELTNSLGYGGTSNFSNYFSSNVASDSLMGIRYLISDSVIDDTVYVLNEKLTPKDTDGVYVYENPFALSVMYSVDNAVIPKENEKTKEFHTPFEYVNFLYSTLLGKDSAPFQAIKLKGVNYGSIYPHSSEGHIFMTPGASVTGDSYNCISYSVPTESGKPIYACFPSDFESEASLYVNDEFITDVESNEGETIFLLGTFDGETLDVELRWKDTKLVIRNGLSYFYQLDVDTVREAHAILSEGQLTDTEFTNTSLSGSFIYSSDRPILYSTVPYDEDWRVKIDGKEVQPIRLSGALMGFDLAALGISEGEHQIELNFVSRSLTLGAIVTALGIAALIAANVAYKPEILRAVFKRRGKSQEK